MAGIILNRRGLTDEDERVAVCRRGTPTPGGRVSPSQAIGARAIGETVVQAFPEETRRHNSKRLRKSCSARDASAGTSPRPR
jgi:hypothetical protein